MMRLFFLFIISILSIIFVGCDQRPLNHPHQQTENLTVFYSSFDEPPKTLDPARAFSMNEAVFIAQIYEPPLQYHYLKRPYTLEPLTAAQMPTVHYLGKNKEILSNDESVNQ